MDLQDQPLYQLQQLIDGVDVGVGQLRALDLGLGGIGQPTSSPMPVPPGLTILNPCH